jgi:hypothetical protein
MDIYFTDPSEVPLPPDEVRIRELRASPYPDGKRVRVYLEVEPFQKRPSAELAVVDDQGQELAAASIVESMTRKMELVMHLRGAQPGASYTLHALLYYVTFEPPTGDQVEAKPIERQPVDQAQIVFDIPVDQGVEG